MRIRALAVAGLFLALPSVASAQRGCRAADDTSARIANYVAKLLADTSQRAAAERDTLGIMGVSPSQITAVTDRRKCSKIVRFFDDFEGVTRPGRRVYAYSIGPTFVAQDPSFKSGEWTPLMFLNGAYKLLQSHMVF